ncbi:MAG: DUF1624 domain-containing protein [Colwellia sp.]|nr:DUF1624 domain-containing protein [Colwellia sp.]
MTDSMSNTYKSRLTSIDFMRGLVMVIMALDHVRDFVFIGHFDPLDLSQTNTVLYFTRWITHLCAPIFVILAGVSAGLMANRLSKIELSKFLIIRGVWLVFIELTVVSVAWDMVILSPQFFSTLQVIWALGMSMIVLSALIWLPRNLLTLVALVIIFGHNAFDGMLPLNNWSNPAESMPFWWSIHVTGFTQMFGFTVGLAYPLIPWIGVMALGYVITPIFTFKPDVRRRVLFWSGIGCLMLFFVLRVPNLYGDLKPWMPQENYWLDFLAIMNVEKYPPSLAYLLATLGISSIIIALAENWQSRFTQWMITFGKVPFFFYIVHLYFIHLIALAIGAWQGNNLMLILGGYWMYPASHGVNLFVTYLIWLAVVIALYFPCRSFMQLKMQRTDWWLKYL